MRHGVKVNHLGRKAGHRKALLSHLASDLIKNKRITTTTAKAKALRVYVEPMITKSKSNTTHQRRMVFSKLQDKEAVSTLFDEIGAKVGSRPGGYTRIIKLGTRLGDASEMALIELVDYNETYSNAPVEKAKKKRTRRGGSKNTAAEAETKEAVKEEVAEDKAEKAEEAVADATEAKAEAEAAAKEDAAQKTETAKEEEAPKEENKEGEK